MKLRALVANPAFSLLIAVLAVSVVIHGNLVWLASTTLIAIFGLVALSVGVAYGQAGIVSLAQGTFAALGAYVSSILTLHWNWSPFASLPFAVLVPGLIAYPLAHRVVRLSPLALAIATLLFGKIVDTALRAGGDFTGGYIGLSGVPPIPGFDEPLRFHLLAWGCVVAVVWLVDNLNQSALGRAIHAIRHDTQRAAADGVPVRRVQSLVFSFGAAVAGLGGWLYAHYSSYISPESLGLNVSISALLMAVVGGSRQVLGPVAGAAILMLIVKYIPGANWQGIFYGGALVLMLLIAPGGLLGTRLGRALSFRAGRPWST